MVQAAAESLADRFAALHAERERTWPAEKLRGNVEQRRALVAAFDPAAVVKAGDRVSPFTLAGASGRSLTLGELTADGPVLLIFFRFAGCPACNIALPHYDERLRPALDAAGVRIVAVSPHLPEMGLDQIRTRHDLGIAVAADRGNVLARRFGLTFLPLGDPPAPVGDPGWIGALTGTGTWELPQPAAVLIDRDHIVRFAEASPDWMARAEAETILAAVARLPAITIATAA